jgi:uncharacterized membrane protein
MDTLMYVIVFFASVGIAVTFFYWGFVVLVEWPIRAIACVINYLTRRRK